MIHQPHPARRPPSASDAIDIIHGLAARGYAGVLHFMSGARTDLVNAVQRIGTREGLTFGVPLTKPLSVADLTVIGNSLLDPGSGAHGWSDAAPTAAIKLASLR